MFNKIDELKCILSVNPDIDIICLNETHFDSDILDAEIHLDGYMMFRKDRNFKLDNSDSNISGGGGSIIYTKSYLDAALCQSFGAAPDSLAINIVTSGGVVCIACVYRSSSLNMEQNKVLLSCLHNICDESNDFETILMGDFNLSKVSWEIGSIVGSVGSKDKNLCTQQMYMNMFNDKGLSWFFTDEVTRRRLVKDTLQQSLLDQVLYTNDALVNDCQIVAPLGKSDHMGVHVELTVSSDKDRAIKSKIMKPSWGKVSNLDLLKFSSDNIDWNYTCSADAEVMWEELHEKLLTITETVPCTAVFEDSKPVKLPWSNSKLKRARKNKDHAWAIFDDSPTRVNLNYAIEKQNSYENEETKCKLKYERKITSNLKVNCKSLFSYLRNKRQVKCSVPSLDKGDGTRTKNQAEAAEILADAFSSVFVAEPCGPLPEMLDNKADCIPDLEVSSASVKCELQKLNIYKSLGPDRVHPKLLKALSYDARFVDAVTDLFNVCLKEGKLPSVWKSATVVGLFKKGSKSHPLNYRPVSLTCILCKVFEQLVRGHIVDYLEGCISTHQHGFVKGKSCLSNLLEMFDDILELLEQGAPVDLFYFDFSKAFDTVPHYRLLSKLESFGINGRVLEIIRDFLTNRTISVQVGGKHSTTRKVLSGVPQGSVLGPLLFVLFINDLPEAIKNKVKLFADDLKLICNASDRKSVLEDIEELEIWESIWLLRFNPSKCTVMHLEFNDNPCLNYTLDGTSLEMSEQEKDLGVWTHKTLNWDKQIKASISKANKMICWVVRNLITRDRTVMLAIYKALIRPHLEYCVQLWNPTAAHGSWGIILELEGVQRRFTRLIDGIGTLPYSSRLENLKLTTLAERRVRGDLIETFKIISGLVEYGSDLFNVSRSGSNIVSKVKCGVETTKFRNLRKSFLPERVIYYWNALPVDVKNSFSVSSFKENL